MLDFMAHKSLTTLLATRAPNDNVRLFAKYGPWWMSCCIVLERLPWRSIAIIAVWRLCGH
jgi:hypothetical protein